MAYFLNNDPHIFGIKLNRTVCQWKNFKFLFTYYFSCEKNEFIFFFACDVTICEALINSALNLFYINYSFKQTLV